MPEKPWYAIPSPIRIWDGKNGVLYEIYGADAAMIVCYCAEYLVRKEGLVRAVEFSRCEVFDEDGTILGACFVTCNWSP